MGNREWGKRPHERLEVWRDAMGLVEAVHRIPSRCPDSELTSQERRAAVSVPSNIAEGAARTWRAECVRDLSIARGSLSDLDTQRQHVQRPAFVEIDQDVDALIDRLFARLTAQMKALVKLVSVAGTPPDSPFPFSDSLEHAR